MQISSRLLMNSAEGILKDRKQDSKSTRQSDTASESKASTGPADLSRSVLESKLIGLQSSLSTLQNDYTKEQVRLEHLNRSPVSIDPEAKFNGERLFPEGVSTADAGTLKRQSKESMDNIERRLRTVQIEMENMLALNMSAAPDLGGLRSQLRLDHDAVRRLDPDRVARLTR